MIKVYTDGSCKPTNPGPAGYGVVVLFDDDTVSTSSKFIGEATNNIAEIMGLQYALTLLKELECEWEEIDIYTDSQYVIGLFSKDWKPKVNQELIKTVKEELELFPNLSFKWVKAHNGDRYNEIADKLAKAAVDNSGD